MINKKYLIIAFLIGLAANLDAGFLDNVTGANEKAAEAQEEAAKKAEEAKKSAEEKKEEIEGTETTE